MTTVADRIVQRLLDAGVGAMFGMPGGGSNLDLIDAAKRRGLPFILTATETGAALAAIAHSDVSGGPGVCLTTLGPGVASVVNGVACARLDRAPLLVITDCHPASATAFEHQRIDHRALLTPVTKWSAPIGVADVDDVLDRAIARATAGPAGPVHLDLAFDVARARAVDDGARSFEQRHPDERHAPPSDQRPALPVSESVAALIRQARRPLLLVGLGARRAADAVAVRALCAAHGVPALVTYKAKGVVADADPHFAGVFTNAAIEQPILADADLFIGIGLDPVELIPRPWMHAAPIINCTRWRVDERQIAFTDQFVGDPSATLEQIGQLLQRSSWNLDAVHRAVNGQRMALREHHGSGLAPASAVDIIARSSGSARVAVDAGAHMFPATMLWPVTESNGMLISNGLSTMGFAVPAAIGAAVANRDRHVVALTGDGGLLICAGELLTAARERLRIVTVVFNDASLSLIAVKQRQMRHESAGVVLGNVRWDQLADSVGVNGHVASDARQLERALAEALAHDGPSLIDIRIDPASYGEILRMIRGA